MLVYVPWVYEYHAPSSGEYLDFYRFSRDGVRYLFKDFSHMEFCPVRGCLETLFNLVPLTGKKSIFMRLFGGLIKKLDKYDERYASGFNIYLVK